MDERAKQNKNPASGHGTMPSRDELVKSHKKDTVIALGVFLVVTIASFFFNELASDPMLNIAMLYTLGVFVITRYTDGYRRSGSMPTHCGLVRNSQAHAMASCLK